MDLFAEGKKHEVSLIEYLRAEGIECFEQESMQDYSHLKDLLLGDIFIRRNDKAFYIDVKSSSGSRGIPISQNSLENFRGSAYAFQDQGEWFCYPKNSIFKYYTKVRADDRLVKLPSGDMGFYFPTNMYTRKKMLDFIS